MDIIDLDKELNSYLSVDNGKGILLKDKEVECVSKLGIDIYNYDKISVLLSDILNMIGEEEIDDDVEEMLDRLKEMQYYSETNK